jgi:hypothetical protein
MGYGTLAQETTAYQDCLEKLANFVRTAQGQDRMAELMVIRHRQEVKVHASIPPCLRLAVQRLGQSRPSKLVLEKRFSAYTASRLSTSPDLERSFGPIYARGLLRKGQSSFAVLGVNGQETQASIDAALTFGILWLDVRREQQAGKAVVEGLKLFLPRGCSVLTRRRIAHLNAGSAKWQLYEVEEREDELKGIDLSDRGNVRTRWCTGRTKPPPTSVSQKRLARYGR